MPQVKRQIRRVSTSEALSLSSKLLSAHLHTPLSNHPDPKQKQSLEVMAWKEKAQSREGWISPAPRMASEA